MINPQLSDYINKAHQAGSNNEQIRTELLKAGWQEADLNEALSPAPHISIAPEKSNRTLLIAAIVSVVLLIGAGSVVAMRYFTQSLVNKNVALPTVQEPTATSQNVNITKAVPQVNSNVSEDTGPTTETNQTQPKEAPGAEVNTKSYYNPVYKYSISYPQEYSLSDSNTSTDSPYGALPEGDIAILKRPYDPNEVINIYISKGYDSEKYTSFDDYISMIKSNYQNGKYGTKYTINDILIGKDRTIKAIEFYSEGPVNLYETYFNRDNNYLKATIPIIPKQDQKSIEQIYRDILSSLSFN